VSVQFTEHQSERAVSFLWGQQVLRLLIAPNVCLTNIDSVVVSYWLKHTKKQKLSGPPWNTLFVSSQILWVQ